MKYEALFVGILVGVICVGGLSYGTKLLMSVMENPDMEASKRRRRQWLATFFLIGQFVAALGILYFSPFTRPEPLATGLGMMGSIFAMSLTMGSLFKN